MQFFLQQGAVGQAAEGIVVDQVAQAALVVPVMCSKAGLTHSMWFSVPTQQVMTIAFTLDELARPRSLKPCSAFLRCEMSRPVPNTQGKPPRLVRAQ